MSGSTTTEGFPYPLTADFADVQDAFRLASAVDGDIRAAQDAFRAAESHPAFIGRQTANGSGYISGTSSFKFGTVDWDSTGGAVAGATNWSQPLNESPSWWLLGASLLVAIITGTPVVGDMCMARLSITTTDQVSNVASTTYAYQRNDETNTGGEFLNVFTIAQIYRASVTADLILNGTTQKAISAGSSFWGLYLGPVT